MVEISGLAAEYKHMTLRLGPKGLWGTLRIVSTPERRNKAREDVDQGDEEVVG